MLLFCMSREHLIEIIIFYKIYQWIMLTVRTENKKPVKQQSHGDIDLIGV